MGCEGVVKAEVLSMIAIMRNNARWSLSTAMLVPENEHKFIRDFKALRRDLNLHSSRMEQSSEMLPMRYLRPFLRVIKSPEASGLITGAALNSVLRFLESGMLNREVDSAAQAVAMISHSVVNCRFEATDPASDDVVLARILDVLLACVQCEIGDMLPDSAIAGVVNACFEMLHTGYRCRKSRPLSELLRSSAERVLVELVRTVFSRLDHIPEQTTTNSAPIPSDPIDSASESGCESATEEGQTKTVCIVGVTSGVGEAQIDSKGSQSDNGGKTAGDEPQNPGEDDFVQVEGEEERDDGGVPKRTSADIDRNGSEGEHEGDDTYTETDSLVGSSIVSGPPYMSSPARHGAEPHKRMKGRRAATLSSSAIHGSPYGLVSVESILSFINRLMCPCVEHTPCPLCSKQAAWPLTGVDDPQARLLGMTLLAVAIEAGGDNICRHPLVVHMIAGDGMRLLLQNTATQELAVLALSLSTLTSLYMSALRPLLTPQFEILFGRVYLQLVDKPRSLEVQEIALEALTHLCHLPGFGLDLFSSYDCELSFHDVFETLYKALCKAAYPVDGFLSSLHLLALDAMHAIVEGIADRCAETPPRGSSLSDGHATSCTKPALEVVLEQAVSEVGMEHDSRSRVMSAPGHGTSGPLKRKRSVTVQLLGEAAGVIRDAGGCKGRKELKRRLTEIAEKFNVKPKQGIEHLCSSGILESASPESIALFLRHTKMLDKAMIGEYIGKSGDFSNAVLRAFVETFDFRGQRPDEAMRMFLEAFRIPGEAQIIDRVMECFSQHYYKLNKEIFPIYKSADALFVLAFSIIMLNTDQHNPMVKNRMTLEEFRRNVRGTNDGEDWPEQMLSEIYTCIQTNEIKIQNAEEVHDVVVTTSTWNDLLARVDTAVEKAHHPASSPGSASHGSGSAAGGCNSTLGAAGSPSVPADSTTPSLLAPRHDAKRKAGRKLPSCLSVPPLHRAFDPVMFSSIWGPTVSAFSSVFDKSLPNDEDTQQHAIEGFINCAQIAAHYDMCDVLDNLVIALCKFTTLLQPPVENQIVHFGRNIKAQLAATTVFGITRRQGDHLREGWRNIVDCVLRLYHLGVLPQLIPPSQDPLAGSLSSFETPGRRGSYRRKKEKQNGTWFLSNLSSYLLLTPEPASQPSPMDKDAEDNARKASRDCRVEEIVMGSSFLRTESLGYLARALALHVAALDSASGGFKGEDLAEETPFVSWPEEEGLVCLELLTEILLRNQARVLVLWPIYRDVFLRILASPTSSATSAVGSQPATSSGKSDTTRTPAADNDANEGASSSEAHAAFRHRAALGVLRLAVRYMNAQAMAGELLQGLGLLVRLPAADLAALSEPLATTLLMVIRGNAKLLGHRGGWHTVYELLQNCARFSGGSRTAFQALQSCHGCND
eukprot:Rmarinus@m.16881